MLEKWNMYFRQEKVPVRRTGAYRHKKNTACGKVKVQ